MPYKTNNDLPKGVQHNLPSHAQTIYREAYNHAWLQYQDPTKRRSAEPVETIAHKVAWAAVEKKYYKDEQGNWQPCEK